MDSDQPANQWARAALMELRNRDSEAKQGFDIPLPEHLGFGLVFGDQRL